MNYIYQNIVHSHINVVTRIVTINSFFVGIFLKNINAKIMLIAKYIIPIITACTNHNSFIKNNVIKVTVIRIIFSNNIKLDIFLSILL